MGLPSVFLFYMEKKKISSLYRAETTIFLHDLYGGFFPRFFCAILTKIKGVSIFVSIPHCPMNYCIPAYSTVFFSFFFFFYLLNKALLVIVRNNLDSNSVEY